MPLLQFTKATIAVTRSASKGLNSVNLIKRTAALLVFVLAAFACAALSQQETKRSSTVRLLENGHLYIKADNMEVRALLEDYFKATGEEFTIDPEVVGDIKLDREDEPDTMLQAITRQVDATYMILGNRYRVLPRVKCGPNPHSPPSMITRDYVIETIPECVLRLDVDCMDVRMVLQDLGLAIGKRIKLEPNVQGAVTLDVREVGFDKVLDMIVRQVDAVAEARGDSYTVRRK